MHFEDEDYVKVHAAFQSEIKCMDKISVIQPKLNKIWLKNTLTDYVDAHQRWGGQKKYPLRG